MVTYLSIYFCMTKIIIFVTFTDTVDNTNLFVPKEKMAQQYMLDAKFENDYWAKYSLHYPRICYSNATEI